MQNPSDTLSAAIGHLDATTATVMANGEQSRPTHLDDHASTSCAAKITTYLLERVPEFKELQKIRDEGWKKPEGDVFFKRQRRNADNADLKTMQFFYTMMQDIARELQKATRAFTVQPERNTTARILDTCMAPGGFLQLAMITNRNSDVEAVAFTLPSSSGGHHIMLPQSDWIDVRKLDITMLAADIGAESIPLDHPDRCNFLPLQLNEDTKFDLVISDGQVLRTHARLEYRERHEARRLITAQLVIGLKHMRPGGTLVMLQHRVEAWATIRMLQVFNEISNLQLYKPKKSHAKRSSFYMVAKNVQSDSETARLAIEEWTETWKASTFGYDDPNDRDYNETKVQEVLEEFGPSLIALGRDVWAIQAVALENASFNKKKG